MSAQADVSAEGVARVRAALDQIPAGAVWVENWKAMFAHTRCRRLNAENHGFEHLKGMPVPDRPFDTVQGLRQAGYAGIYRRPKEA